MKRLLGPGFLWPLFIVALLGTSVSMCVFAVIASRSDGGVQPVPDYYTQAAHYDALSREAAASDSLGWEVEVIPEALQPGGLRTLQFTLSDADGQPLTGLTGEVSIGRPSQVETAATVPFHSVEGSRYAAALPMQASGLWDVTIHARRAETSFARTVRIEVP